MKAEPATIFPDEWSCTAWEDCQHDGVCHDPTGCGAIGPNHHAIYGMLDDEDRPMTHDTPPKRIWACAGCGLQMPGNCDCVTNVATSWEPDHRMVLKGQLRMETTSENIARDMSEGRFPERSEPQVVVIPEAERKTILASEAEAMVAAALRDLAQRVALRMEVLSAMHQSWPLRTAGKVDAILALIPQPASAALDKLIAEAVNEAMLQCIGIVANLRNKRNPGPLFEVLNMAMSDIEDARFAAIREKNNG